MRLKGKEAARNLFWDNLGYSHINQRGGIKKLETSKPEQERGERQHNLNYKLGSLKISPSQLPSPTGIVAPKGRDSC